MKYEDPGERKDLPVEQRLPGANRAGKGSRPRKEDDREKNPRGGGATHQEQLEEHSLPGTNQAGKGPGSRDKSD
ncbi:MAG: hypothetical protein R6V57_04355 [Vicinamibacterales bacterium]